MGRTFCYKVYDQKKLLGIYTLSEFAHLIGCSKDVLQQCVEYGLAYRKRYTFEQYEIKLSQKDILADAWEEIRQRLLNSGYDLGRIQIVRAEEA